MYLLFSYALVALAFWCLLLYRKVRSFPDGPIPFPLVGNFLQIDLQCPHRTFVAWLKRYGSIYTVWLPKPIIVIANYAEMEELMKKRDDFDDRPMSFLYLIFSGGQKDGDGIILARGQRWKNERGNAQKFFGKISSRLEELVSYHSDQLISRLMNSAENVDKIVGDINLQLSFCTGNIIQDIVMGRHYAYDDPEFLHLRLLITRIIKNVSSVQMLIIDNCPMLRFFFPTYWQYVKDGFELQNFFLDEIKRHKQSLDLHTESSNFIDAYLTNEENKPISPLTLALDSGDMWAGGFETSTLILTWAIIYLIRNPKIQKKLWTEITNVLDGAPFKISTPIPYLRAFIDELLRIVNVLPWNLPHAANKEVTLCGKKIPAGTGIMPQIGAIHFDENNFPNPYEFCPERFLTNEGKYVASKFLCPFGMGKRRCLGQNLAQKELQIILVALVRNFEFEAVDSEHIPSLRRKTGMTTHPEPFCCKIKRRCNA